MERESERRELWHQLDNESDRAHDAFKCYMLLPPAERSVVGAWREWSGNPDAKREPPYFAGWAKDYAWGDRARARDHHLEIIRERGMEAAIEREVAEQARQAERVRNRYNELLARTYLEAIEYMESGDFVRHMRPSDVINVMKVHFEATRYFGETLQQDEREIADLTPDELAELENIVGEIEAGDQEKLAEETEEGSDDGKERSEDTEGEQD
jgi:hypothetical protein